MNVNEAFVSIVIPLLIPILIGLVLIMSPSTVANRIVLGDEIETGPGVSSTLGLELRNTGVVVLGIYLLYRAISDSVYHFLNYRVMQSMLGGKARYDDVEFRRFLRRYQHRCLLSGKAAATRRLNEQQAAVWSSQAVAV